MPISGVLHLGDLNIQTDGDYDIIDAVSATQSNRQNVFVLEVGILYL